MGMVVFQSLFIFNFKDMIKRALSIFVFLFLFISIFIYLNKVFATCNISVNVQENYRELTGKADVDVLFYGSSHSYTAYNPLIINKICKTVSYNLGSAALNMSIAEMVLEETLKQSQPGLIVLDLYKGSLIKPSSKEAKGFQLRALDIISNLSYKKYTVVKNLYDKDEYIGVYFPLIRNHSKWQEYSWFDLSRQQQLSANSHYFYGGYRGHYQTISDEQSKRYKDFKETTVNRNSNVFVINDQSKAQIEDFIMTAKNKGLEVLIISSPDLRARFDDYRIFDQLEEICKNLGVSFLNLNDHYNEMELTLEDFMDSSHLNIYGGTKASTFLANYINKNYSLKDRSHEAAWSETNVIYNESKDLFARKKEIYHIDLNKRLLNNTLIKSLDIVKNNRKNEISIEFDNTLSFEDDFENNIISFKIVPINANELSEESKTKGWNFDKIDVSLKGNSNKVRLQLISKIRQIKQIEIFLYNSVKYEGVVGEKIILTDVLFE